MNFHLYMTCHVYLFSNEIDQNVICQSMKIINYVKIKEWIDSSIGQSTVIQALEGKDLHYPIKTKHKIGEGTLILKMVLMSFVV